MTNLSISDLLIRCSNAYAIMAQSTDGFIRNYPFHQALAQLNNISNECLFFSNKFGGLALIAISQDIKDSAQKIHDASEDLREAIKHLQKTDDIFKGLANFISQGGTLATAIISEDKSKIEDALANMFS